MAKLRVKRNAVSQTVWLFIQNNAATDGSGLTGLSNSSYNTAGDVSFIRPGQASTPITLASISITSGFTEGGFVEANGTHMPGVYRFDVPNAVFATSANNVLVSFKNVGSAAPVLVEFQLDNMAEPTSPPSATASLEEKVNWIFAMARNEIRQTSGQQTLRNDGNTSDIGNATVTDDGTTFTRQKFS